MIVGQWLAEVKGEQRSAERALATAHPKEAASADGVRAMIASQAGIRDALAVGTPDEKAAFYGDLGLMLTYQPATQEVLVEASPSMGLGSCRRADRTDPRVALERVKVSWSRR